MKRIPIIDFIRFASIFVVIGNHFWPRWLASFTQSIFFQKIVLDFFINGPYGVTCFFVVSGFLITQMLIQKETDFSKINLKTFYVRRIGRILPLLLVIVLIGFLMEQAVGHLGAWFLKYNAWKDVTGFGWAFWASLFSFTFNWYLIAHQGNGFHHGDGLQWSLIWSLSVEEQFYFCYPLTIKFLKNQKRVLCFLGIVALSGSVFRFFVLPSFNINPFLMHQASFGAFDQIAIGGLLYFLNEQWSGWLEQRPKISLWIMLSGIGFCLCFFMGTSFDNGYQYVVVPTLLAISCAVAILGGLHVSALNSKIAHFLSWPGKLSYGCYLWHPTLIILLMPVLVSLGGFRALAYLILVVTVFSFFSFRYFEVPVNHWIRTRFKSENVNL